jgi:hypothetical protein
MLRSIFRTKRDEVIVELRKLEKGVLNDLYSSPNFRMIKSRRTRWARHVARMGRNVHTGFWWGNLKERDHLEEPGVDDRIILTWIFRKWDGDIDWVDLAQDWERWRALVNAVMNLQVP